MNVMKIFQRILWYFSPCRKCKEKDLEGLVVAKKVYLKRSIEKGINKNE